MENNSNNNQEFFMQFSDQLRLQGSSFGSNDSIWSSTFTTKKPEEERRNFDIRVGAQRSNNDLGFKQNGFNNGWKISGFDHSSTFQKNSNGNGNGNGIFNKGVYFKSESNNTNNNNFSNKVITNEKSSKKNEVEGKFGKKGNNNNNNNNSNKQSSSVDKRFKSLPLSESLPRGEVIGGYIFVCNNDTMQENLQRQLFGLPPRYRDSVRAITPGLPLFLYNYSNHQLHGIFEASSFGGANIDPKAWEDKKCPGESRFPAQVKVVTRKICDPLEEDSFRPILHHYDGPKFRLELSVPEALALLDVFAES